MNFLIQIACLSLLFLHPPTLTTSTLYGDSLFQITDPSPLKEIKSLRHESTETSSPDPLDNSTVVAQEFYLHDLKTLLQSLEDPVAHEKFISQIRALIALQEGKLPQKENPVSATWRNVVTESQKIADHISFNIGLASKIRATTKAFFTDTKMNGNLWKDQLLYILISVILGVFVAFLSTFILRPLHAYVGHFCVKKKSSLLISILLKFILWAFPYVCFALTTYASSVTLNINSVMQPLLLDMLTGGLVIRVTHILLNTLSHLADSNQTAPLKGETSPPSIWSLSLLAGLMCLMIALFSMKAFRIPSKSSELFNPLLGLIILIQFLHFILRNRDHFKDFLNHHFRHSEVQEDRLRSRIVKTFSQIWYVPVIVAAFVIYLITFFKIEGGSSHLAIQTSISLSIFFLTRLFANELRKHHKQKLSAAFSVRFPGLHSRLNHRIQLLGNVLSYCFYALAIYIQLHVWKIDLLHSFFDQKSALWPFMKGALKIGSCCLMAYGIWIWMDIFIEKHIQREDHKAENLKHSLSARVRTLLPIFRKSLLFALSAMVVFVSLGTIGIDTTPMLGGAAVVSLAISFGAQGFIKDILSGFFIILEDSVVVDDIVDIDGKMGKVEAVTIRSIQLRNQFGAVHTIPFGTVKVLTNMTREYAYTLINFNLSYDQDIDTISEVLTKVGEDFTRDPKYAALVLGNLEVKGIDHFTDFSVVLQCAIKTKPGEQFTVKRGLYHYIKNEFDRQGTPIPRPQ